MKKSTIIVIFLVSFFLKIQAQDYLISFAGSGDTNVVNTVKVENLTSRDTVTLNGSDILHLSATVGIGSPDRDNGALKVYPNPMAEQSTLTFVSSESGNAVICVVDLSGKTVCQTSALLSRGVHSFHVSGINRGMYFVKVSGKNYFHSIKLTSQSMVQSDARIEYVSSVENIPGKQLKSSAATIDMLYTNGDQLLFKGISGIYRTVVPDVPTSSKTITFNFAACTDDDNNNYFIVQTGTQNWMAENLNVGVRINGNQNQTNNGIIEKYCYDNNDSNCTVYGGLYQWNETMQYDTTSGSKGICPSGWHLPTDAEWTSFTTFLGGDTVAGGKVKSTGTIETGTSLWYSPNTGATNESGFTAFPAGSRSENGMFDNAGLGGNWWCSSAWFTYAAWFRGLNYNYSNVHRYVAGINVGFSVRCLRD